MGTREAHEGEEGSQGAMTMAKWERPDAPFIKLNTDAGTCTNGGGMLSGVLRDGVGICIAAFAERKAYPDDSVLLEALALKRGMEVACELGITELLIESECRTVISVE